jgi:hypothetical protein
MFPVWRFAARWRHIAAICRNLLSRFISERGEQESVSSKSHCSARCLKALKVDETKGKIIIKELKLNLRAAFLLINV